MHEIYELKEMLMKELEEYGRKGELTGGSLEVIDKLAHALKNIDKVIEAKEMEEEEYSMEGGSYERGGNSYARGGSGGGGQGGGGSSRNSYARGRGRNARRDSMGRYSSEGRERRYSREGGMNRYSREGGYSRAEDMEDMVESIRSMMGDLPQEVQRDAQKFVQKLEESMM